MITYIIYKQSSVVI